MFKQRTLLIAHSYRRIYKVEQEKHNTLDRYQSWNAPRIIIW